jgi:2-iminobutanoate/2-iminopropanoate deaminase
MTRKAINSTLAATIGAYSHAVESNGLLFLSGQTPVDLTSGKLVEGDVERQTEQCLRNLSNVLSAAHLSEVDVISVNVYLTDMNDFAQMNAVYARHFSAPYPARTTIGCASLPLAAKVEIGLIARLRSDRGTTPT